MRNTIHFAVLAVWFGAAASLTAHEIGASRVSAMFEDGRTFNVQIVTDATALVEKLEASRGGSLPDGADAPSLNRLLSGFDEAFRKRVKIAFDGLEVRPEISYTVVPPVDATSAAAATIRLTGPIPPGARQFSWSFGWTFATYSLSARTSDSAHQPITQWLEGGQASAPFALSAPAEAAGRLNIAWRYLVLGFTHIVPHGFDHMLFVLGIYLLSRRTSAVLWQVSAFTLAHSITLGLSMYGLVSVPARIVEPLIAISIAYVAIENLFLSELKSWRVALIFAFGLLHGMGFAGALQEVGLPRAEFATALLTFNIGVEAGQLAVIGAAFLLVGWHYSNRDWYRSRVVVPASLLIACTAIYWTFERIYL
jgi:hypothetical protein